MLSFLGLPPKWLWLSFSQRVQVLHEGGFWGVRRGLSASSEGTKGPSRLGYPESGFGLLPLSLENTRTLGPPDLEVRISWHQLVPVYFSREPSQKGRERAPIAPRALRAFRALMTATPPESLARRSLSLSWYRLSCPFEKISWGMRCRRSGMSFIGPRKSNLVPSEDGFTFWILNQFLGARTGPITSPLSKSPLQRSQVPLEEALNDPFLPYKNHPHEALGPSKLGTGRGRP